MEFHPSREHIFSHEIQIELKHISNTRVALTRCAIMSVPAGTVVASVILRMVISEILLLLLLLLLT
jgi:hypothetical protein